MTLVLALKWYFEESEAILMASDSKVSLGPLSYDVKKIYLIYGLGQVPLAVAGGPSYKVVGTPNRRFKAASGSRRPYCAPLHFAEDELLISSFSSFSSLQIS